MTYKVHHGRGKQGPGLGCKVLIWAMLIYGVRISFSYFYLPLVVGVEIWHAKYFTTPCELQVPQGITNLQCNHNLNVT